MAFIDIQWKIVLTICNKYIRLMTDDFSGNGLMNVCCAL